MRKNKFHLSWRLLWGALFTPLVGGCSYFGVDNGFFADDGQDYFQAKTVADIQTPPDYQVKSFKNMLPIPTNVSTEGVKGDFELPPPSVMSTESDSGDFSLQKTDKGRWIVTQNPVEKVWPLAQSFFVENGFKMDSESPQMGEFTTHWVSYSDLSENMSRRLASRVSGIDPMAEVRVRVRIEPGVVRNTSEIFVLTVERPAGSKAIINWPDESSNTKLEAALMDDLVASMARAEEEGGSVSMLAAKPFDAPKKVTLTNTAKGKPELLMSTDYDRAWSSVGRALDMADIRVEDLNRSDGIYYINLAQGAKKPKDTPSFFTRLFGTNDTPDDDSSAERYQLRLIRKGPSEIGLMVMPSGQGSATQEQSLKILEKIQEQFDE